MPELATPPPPQPDAPDWTIEGADWPHRAHSHFHQAGRHVWHVQRLGEGPAALLIHGTGASTHSWAGLMPLLAARHEVIALDLLGHGFTQADPYTLPTLTAMTDGIAALLADLGRVPQLVIGHSAGAAIMVRLAASSRQPPRRLVSINGALRPFPGFARIIASNMARMLTFGGFAARMLSQGAQDRSRVERLLHQTGAQPPEESINCYTALLRRPAHVAGTLSMMANWDLAGIEDELRALASPILFIAGGHDRTVAPSEAERLASLAQDGRARTLARLGHLAHETDPHLVADLIELFDP